MQNILRLINIPRFSLKKALPFFGPAYLVSVGYIDPGNWATNIEGGASFGYTLLWVLLVSNLMAILLQILSAKLGIATGYSLAANIRYHFPKPIVYVLWVLSSLAAIATDLAEFLGASLGLNILLGIPLLPAALLTGIITYGILLIHRRGYRKVEYIIISLVSIVAFTYVFELFLAKPNFGEIAYHVFVPTLDSNSIFVAIGMLGATVMPHNLFLHSGIILSRRKENDLEHNKKILHYAKLDSIIALNTAWFINSSMIIIAAAVFFQAGINVTSIEEAYVTLTPLLGKFASIAFAIALLSSGLSSSVTGTMAGQFIIQDFVKFSIPFWVRRLITMIPAIIIIGLGINTLNALITSQVILSLVLPFSVIPLIIFTSNKKIMGDFVNKPWVTILTIIVALFIIFLNALLIYNIFA